METMTELPLSKYGGTTLGTRTSIWECLNCDQKFMWLPLKADRKAPDSCPACTSPRVQRPLEFLNWFCGDAALHREHWSDDLTSHCPGLHPPKE